MPGLHDGARCTLHRAERRGPVLESEDGTLISFRRQYWWRRHAVRHGMRIGDLMLDAFLSVGLPDHEPAIVCPAIGWHPEVLQRLVHAVVPTTALRGKVEVTEVT
jgi:hypothetical protein